MADIKDISPDIRTIAFDVGYKAAREGRKIKSCSFQDSKVRKMWEDGWRYFHDIPDPSNFYFESSEGW